MKVSKELSAAIFQEFLHDQLERARRTGKTMTPEEIHSVMAMADSKAQTAIDALEKRWAER